MVTHAVTQLMHRYQKRNESLQEINFDFSELIQAVTNHEPKDIPDPLKIHMYVQRFFNPIISSKTIWQSHQTLQKAIDYAQKVEREFSLVEGNQQKEFDSIMSINAFAGNNPMIQQRVFTITCYECGPKVILGKIVLIWLAQAQYKIEIWHKVP